MPIKIFFKNNNNVTVIRILSMRLEWPKIISFTLMSRACPQVSKFSTSLSSDHSDSSILIETGQASWQTDRHDPTFTERQREKITTLVRIPRGSIELFLPLLSQQLLIEHLLYLGSLHILVCVSKENPFLVQGTLVNRTPSHGD